MPALARLIRVEAGPTFSTAYPSDQKKGDEMKAFIAGAVLVAAVVTGGPIQAQTSVYRFADPTTLVGPGSSIGVRVRELTADEAKAGPSGSSGVYIEAVVGGTPADRAGFRKGDVVIEFDGERVRSVRGFTRLVSETPPQRTVKAVILRDGSRQTLDVTPESGLARNDTVQLPGLPLLRPRGAEPILPRMGILRYRGWIGVTLETVTGQMAEYFGVSAGALVSAVDLDSPASRAGLKAGDVITAANGQAVRDAAAVSQAVRAVRPGSKLDLKIVRDRKEMAISVEVPTAQPMLLGGR
jgi:serine protease Do